jgi:sugar lactone lactonase YvrE
MRDAGEAFETSKASAHSRRDETSAMRVTVGAARRQSVTLVVTLALAAYGLAATAAHATPVPPPLGATPGELLLLEGGGFGPGLGEYGATTSSTFASPYGVAVDAEGDVYVADTDDNEVRELTPGGQFIVVAGTGVAGYTGDAGPAYNAELNAPDGVAVDAAGDLFIADTGNNVIREVTPQDGSIADGTISTYAGDGTAGDSGDGGAPTSAELDQPMGVAVSASGEVAIADTGNDTVRVVRAVPLILSGAREHDSGVSNLTIVFPTHLVIETVAGTGSPGADEGDGGPGTSATLDNPSDVAFDSSGDIFIADSGNSAIRELNTSTNDISTVAEVPYPTSVAVDAAGDLYVTDPFENKILEVLAGSTLTTVPTVVAGTGALGDSGADGPATSAELDLPSGLAIDPYDDVFFTDTGNDVLDEVVAARAPYFTVASPPTIVAAQATYSYSFFATGVPDPTYSLAPGAPSWLSINHFTGALSGTLPSGVTSFTYSVVATNSSGPTTAGPFTVNVPVAPLFTGATVSGALSEPIGLATDYIGPGATGLWVADAGIDDLVSLLPSTHVEAELGVEGVISEILGTSFAAPTGVVEDQSDDDVWIADNGDNQVFEFSLSTRLPVATISSAWLSDPRDVVLNGADEPVVADTGHNRITVGLPFTTIIGPLIDHFGTLGSGNGELDEPNSVAVDSAGDYWVADTANHRVEEFSPSGAFLASFTGAGTGFTAFAQPWGIYVDASNDVWVTDRGTDTITELSSTGQPALRFGVAGSADGDLNDPSGILVSPTGVVSVADTGNHRVEQFSPAAAPAFTADSPPLSSNQGSTYSYEFTASGAPLPTFSLAAGAPSWLTINASTGTVSGVVPSATTTFTYSVVAANIHGSKTAGPFTVSVGPPLVAPVFTTDTPSLGGTGGGIYAYTFAASGYPAPTYSLAAGAPFWLTINSSSGALSGVVPPGTTSFSYAVRATNSSATATAGPFTVTVPKPFSPINPILGKIGINTGSGVLTLIETVLEPGTFNWLFTFDNGKFGVFAGKRHKLSKCTTGEVKLKGKCRPAAVTYARGTTSASAAGTVTFTADPSAAAKAALKTALEHHEGLTLTVSISFQPSAGGNPFTQTQTLTVKLAKPKHKKH